MNENINTNINIITCTNHLIHMQSISSVCPDAPKKKRINTINHMQSIPSVCPDAPKKKQNTIFTTTVTRKLF
jgi:hypothetical protein